MVNIILLVIAVLFVIFCGLMFTIWAKLVLKMWAGDDFVEQIRHYNKTRKRKR